MLQTIVIISEVAFICGCPRLLKEGLLKMTSESCVVLGGKEALKAGRQARDSRPGSKHWKLFWGQGAGEQRPNSWAQAREFSCDPGVILRWWLFLI